jgi:hypothetical protein
MKSKYVGIVFIVLGIFLMAYTGFTYVTTEKVVDLGAVKINREKEHFVQWPPVAGGVSLVIGLAFLISFRKK